MNRLACFVTAALCALSLAAPLAAEPPASPALEPEPDVTALWAEARKSLPELRAYTPVQDPDPALQALLAWVAPSGKATVYDERCRPIPVTRDGDELVGSRVIHSSTRGRVRTVETEEVRFGATRTLLGSTTTTYRRDERGKWVEEGVSACGCAAYPAGTLRQVKGGAAWYDGRVVTLKVHCGLTDVETAPCREGEGERTCRTCTRLAVDVQAVGEGWAASAAVTATAGVNGRSAVDCTAPCPPDDLGALVLRLKPALEGLQFLQAVHPAAKPALYRTLARCRGR